MKKALQLTAVIEREDDGYVATCPELDVVSQGDTIEQARMNLLEAVEGFFEVASSSETKRRQAFVDAIEARAETVVMMRLAETGFQEWNEEGEDIYNAEA